MTNHRSRYRFSILVFSALLGISVTAHARSGPASSGRVVSPADAACLSDWFSTVTNNCSYWVLYNVPLPIDHNGNCGYLCGHNLPQGWPVEVQVTGSGDGMQISAIAIDQVDTAIYAGQMVSFFGYGTQTVSATSTAMPSNGYLYLRVNLPPGATFNSWNYGFAYSADNGQTQPASDPMMCYMNGTTWYCDGEMIAN